MTDANVHYLFFLSTHNAINSCPETDNEIIAAVPAGRFYKKSILFLSHFFPSLNPVGVQKIMLSEEKGKDFRESGIKS